MSEHTTIGWCDFTFNPWEGCTEVSPGCDNCYARGLAARLHKVAWGPDAERKFLSEGTWAGPRRWDRRMLGEGRRGSVFCGSMCDVLEERDELEPHRQGLWRLIRDTPRLDWLLLTKRPQNYRRMVPPDILALPNVWPGTTCETADYTWRIEKLLALPCAGARFVSYEPILGPLDPARWPGIHWWILGGESGKGHRVTPIEWLIDAARTLHALGRPVFVKQDSGPGPGKQGRIPDDVWAWKKWPLDGDAQRALPRKTGSAARDVSLQFSASRGRRPR
ncbi:MAG TPA: DUF5131 family protein [Candidatus Methylomirabilis sp.]|nr:DUF5131 family protein [Candidatus Methylomirabilis sp.]